MSKKHLAILYYDSNPCCSFQNRFLKKDTTSFYRRIKHSLTHSHKQHLKMLEIKHLFVQLFFSYLISNLHTFVTCYTCDTPDSWLQASEAAQNNPTNTSSEEFDGKVEFQHLLLGQKWPNGEVKYRIHPSLNTHDISELKKAFEEYHSKTCIRFVPWKTGDADFVSIEIDNRFCGKSNVCKIGNYQYAKIGRECRFMATMVHELGHSLCLAHEHQRVDRANYVHYQQCLGSTVKGRLRKITHNATGIYDYASQMHYECGACTLAGWPTDENVHLCGRDLTPGLSVLDADSINALYNCGGEL